MQIDFNNIIHKVINAIDSDDIQATAILVESNLSKDQIDKLQKELKATLQKSELVPDKVYSLRQFLLFMD